MKRLLSFMAVVLALTCFGEERTIAVWDFTKGVPSGEFGGALRKNAQLTKDGLSNKSTQDIESGFVTDKVYPELTPQEGFRYTVTLTTGKGEFEGPKNVRCMLIDNMNVDYKHDNPLYNKGIMFYLDWNIKYKFYTIRASMGFGTETEHFIGSNLPANYTCTIAFVFNGINKMWFEVDGKPSAKQPVKHKTTVAPTCIKTHIGDRMNSVHYPFDGVIHKVVLTAFPTSSLGIEFQRLGFRRNEDNPRLKFQLENAKTEVQTGVKATLAYNGKTLPVEGISIPAEGSYTLEYPIESRLMVGKYPFTLDIEYPSNGQTARLSESGDILIGPISNDRMPIIMMGYRAGLPEERLVDIGFNIGCRNGFTGPYLIKTAPNAYNSTLASLKYLDHCLFIGFDNMDYTNTNNFIRNDYPRISKDGTPYQPIDQVDASNPEAVAYILDRIRQALTPLADHPAYIGMKINSEVRDRCLPSFTPIMTDNYKKDTGLDIPDMVKGKVPPVYQALEDFPFNRIIPMDYPLFQFYRWWWLKGDGWNIMTEKISDLAKGIIQHPIITSHDPAVRVPPLWGDGGNVGYLGHWTYAYPDAINVGINTDEMQAMARGNKSQGIFNETQIICYRSGTAPVDEKIENPPAWALEYPNAPYITIPPDILRTAAWTQISRHVDGIMFHGYNSLLLDEVRKGDTGYQCTNSESAKVLKEILHKVVHPFGPVLKRLPEPPTEVGVLESLAPVFFSGRGSWGWSRGWFFNLNLILQHANLQPKVLYDEEILRDGFGNLKVLFMPHCDILAEPIYKAVTEFQQKGGIIVSDIAIIPSITPDIIIPEVLDMGNPVTFNESICRSAVELKEKLQGFVQPMVTTSDPELTTHYRQDGNATYLFAINGKRTFGDYFGPWKHVCEKGLPLQASLEIRCKAGVVYDLVEHKPVPFTSYNSSTHLDLNYETTGGRLFMLLPTPIGKVSLSAPATASIGKPFAFSAEVFDAKGKRMSSLFPLEITVESPNGKTDDSMYATLQKGKYSQSVIPPINSTPGNWRVTVTELASGKSATATIIVK